MKVAKRLISFMLTIAMVFCFCGNLFISKANAATENITVAQNKTTAYKFLSYRSGGRWADGDVAKVAKCTCGKHVGLPAYCLQFHKTMQANKSIPANADVWSVLSGLGISSAQISGVVLATIYGHPNFNNGLNATPDLAGYSFDDEAANYLATQYIIWEYTMGFRTSADGNDPAAGLNGSLNSPGYGTAAEQNQQKILRNFLKDNSFDIRQRYYYGMMYRNETKVQLAYKTILNSIKSDDIRPSFAGDGVTAGETIELEWNENKQRYEKALIDTNAVLKGGYYWEPSCDNSDVHFEYQRSLELNGQDPLSLKDYTSESIGRVLVVWSDNPDASGTVTMSKICMPTSAASAYVMQPSDSSKQRMIVGTYTNEYRYGYFGIKTTPKLETPGYIQIVKKDSRTGAYVAGANYGVYTNEACTQLASTWDKLPAVLTTSSSGASNKLTIKAGTYYVKESHSPNGYAIDDEVYKVEIPESETGNAYVLNVSDDEVGYCELKKYSKETGEPLSGAEYTIYTDQSCSTIAKDYYGNNAVLTSDVVPEDVEFGDENAANDIASSNKLTMNEGTYYIKETKAPSGYSINSEVYQITIKNFETYTFEAHDSRNGEVSIKKVSTTNSNTTIAGAEYGIFSDESCTKLVNDIDGNPAKLVTTETSSNAVKLLAGTYYIKETKPAEHYSLSNKVYTVTLKAGEKDCITVSDAPKSNLNLTKSSADETIINGNGCYSLEGAVYNVYSDEACKNKVGTLTTDKDGNTNTIEVDAGTYYAKEETASPGYALCEDVHKISVEAGKTGTFTCKEQPLNDPFSLTLNKADADTGNTTPQGIASLAGAVFEVDFYPNTDGNTSGNPFKKWYFQTNETGWLNCSREPCLINTDLFQSDQLYKDDKGNIIYPLGTYTIKEVQPPKYYQMSGTMKFKNPND